LLPIRFPIELSGKHQIPIGKLRKSLARPKRLELLTPRFEVWCSIQLSYERFTIIVPVRLERVKPSSIYGAVGVPDIGRTIRTPFSILRTGAAGLARLPATEIVKMFSSPTTKGLLRWARTASLD
jgi:hypothetical protein